MNKLVALIACVFLVAVTNVFADDSTAPAAAAAPASAPTTTKHHHHHHHCNCECKKHHTS